MFMSENKELSIMENFFMALADKTRLRLLNLMRDGEVCVCFFVEVLKESQPKISRHLAYLRNSGVVEARRDGKWMHYRITEPENESVRRLLLNVLEWLGKQEDMQDEMHRYETACCTPEILVQIARTPIDFALPQAGQVNTYAEPQYHEQVAEEEYEYEPEPVYVNRQPELEDYLL